MTIRFPRGAEWRVWDLQVHTPFSELNNGFGDDLENYAKSFFLKAIEKDVAVIGVTDYFVADGYRYLKELQADSGKLAELVGQENVAKASQITLLANIEFRSDILVEGNRVNFHVIFSEEVSADDIINNFLGFLKFTPEGAPAAIGQESLLTRSNLEAFGRKLKEEHEDFRGKSDIFVGMMQATVDHKLVTESLEKQKARFANKYVFCVPADEDLSRVSWNGQGHATRKLLIQKSHILFSSNLSTREFALGLKHESPAKYLNEFSTFKPCVHSSDAHNFDQLFEPSELRFTWIKADPTFKGLLQAINEPESRVYVGNIPSALLALTSRATKIVRELSIRKKQGSPLTEKWFDHQILLNSELVAIIGNKGSGKSALADILGLIGNTPRHDVFSFLSDKRFNERKNNKGKHFEAIATWADEKLDGPVSLNDLPSVGSVESIKYIPQDYLERICNEVGLGSGSKFYEELQNVIFSHVSEAEKLGQASLDDLLKKRSEETNQAIAILLGQLKGMNRELANCEEQLTEEYRTALEAQLAAKLREVDAHEKNRPTAPPPLESDPGAAADANETTRKLEIARADILEIDGQIALIRQKIIDLTKRRSVAERLMGKIANIEKQVEMIAIEARKDAVELGIDWSDIFKLKVDRNSVQIILSDSIGELRSLEAALSAKDDGSLSKRRNEIETLIGALSLKLSAPQKALEQFKLADRQWKAVHESLFGNVDQPGTIAQLKAELGRIPATKEREQELRKARVAVVKEIYKAKELLRDDYGRYYGAVQRFLSEHPLAKTQQFKLTFNVAVTQSGFVPKFMRLLNQRRAGTFAGVEEGSERLKELIESTDFNSPDGVIRFLHSLMQALKEDQRQGRGSRVTLKDQLASGVSVVDVYDLVFGLSYLEPIYNLQWDGKTLEQLSPGERGNLLLIFYLLIDRDDIPLVIDQPEENLDNNTVYRTLVPCIREAKSRRQIIMVTHNPNLAVVCDADQVICAEIRKQHGHEVRYVSGSIEEPIINRRIVDVLEGTKPAFEKRDSKYFLDDRP